MNGILKLITIGFLLIITAQSKAQVDTAWVRTWDSQFWDEVHAVVTDDSNNIYVAGWSYEWGVNYDFIFSKYSSDGNLVWSKTRNYGSGDEATQIAIGPDGYLYIAGFVYGIYSSTGGYMTLMKYSLNGDSIWEFMDNNFVQTQVSEMAFDHAGNIVLAGFSGATLGSADYLTMKIDANGNQLWYQTFNNYGPNQSNRIFGMCVDDLNNIYVTGACDDTTYFSSDVVTIKYNPAGDTMWQRHFNAPANNYDYGEKILIDPNGDIVIGGMTSTSGPAQTDYMLLKYDTAGNLLWNKYFNYPGPQSFDDFRDMSTDDAGNIYLMGNSSTNNAQNTIRVELIKFDPNGDTIWTARWGAASDYHPMKMVLDNEYNVYISGFYYDNLNSTGYNAFAIKYDSTGALKWETIFADTANLEENFYSLALDHHNDVIAAGRTHSQTAYDFLIVKYQNSISGLPWIETGNRELAISCYPNPFTNSTFVNYYLPYGAMTTIKIFDFLGNEVQTISVGNQLPGNYKVLFEGDGLASGIYICRLESGNLSAQSKIVLTR